MPYSKEHKTKSKHRILQSATELFCRFGFEKVSISEIMKLAKLTHGAFYAHFDSKEALYRSSFIDALKDSSAARLIKGPLSLKHLIELASNYLSLQEYKHTRKAGPEAILFNEIGSDNPEIEQLFETSYHKMRKMLETRITALSRLKQLPFPCDKNVIAEKSRSILASLVGAVALARSLSSEKEKALILSAAQSNILVLLGFNESEVERLLNKT